MPGSTRFRTVIAMDEKLTTMAKCTVFARCSRRELTLLGRLFEVATLGQGAAVPAGGPRGWIHIVLEGRAIGMVEHLPHCLLGEGDAWGSRPDGPSRDALFALTDVTLLTVGVRSLAAVDAVSPSVASALCRGPVPLPAPSARPTTRHRDPVRVATTAGSRNG